MTEPLSKVDSAVEGLDSTPKKAETAKDRRASRKSSSANKAPSRKDYYITKTKLSVAPETQKTGWKMNSSSATVEDKDILNKPVVTPIIRNLDVEVGPMTIPVRNGDGITIKDVMDAIHKKKKKLADEEFKDGVYLKGFEWPIMSEGWEKEAEEAGRKHAAASKTASKEPEKMQEEIDAAIEEEKARMWGTLIVHSSAIAEVSNVGGGKKKKKGGD
ncbi:hypothetical protein F5Y16DRAFT_389751 [Xylariaceae sp. FL0255]|nr:hypothetical protein F5Y16DRAFT_389751 [Xylariaceae sp. FL0255]